MCVALAEPEADPNRDRGRSGGGRPVVEDADRATDEVDAVEGAVDTERLGQARRAGSTARRSRRAATRRRRITSTPSTGAAARRSTAVRLEVTGRHTTFMHQCIPYVKYT